ncbi:MAG: tetratricopeptide repeat protein [Nitrospinales bacterium]
MSYFIKINGWSGSNQESASLKFAKVFRLEKNEANSAMGQISNGLPWQFEHTISDEQCEIAKSFLEKNGFNIELLSSSYFDEMDGMDGQDSFTNDDDPQEYQQYEEPGDMPALGQQGNKAKPKSSKTALMVLLLIVLAGVGLTQTQFGKDLLEKGISQVNELINGNTSEPVAMNNPTPDLVDPGEIKNEVTPKERLMINATLKETKQDFKGAESIYTQIIESDPNDPAAYISRGNARKNMEMQKEGDQDLAKGLNIVLDAISKDPNNASLFHLKATALGNMGNFDAAIEAMKKANALDPENIVYKSGLTMLEMQKKFANMGGS